MSHKRKFVINPKTPLEKRVYVCDAERKLIDMPSAFQMRYRFKHGLVIRATGKRLKCPHRRDSRGFWTTIEADEWFHKELNRLEGCDG